MNNICYNTIGDNKKKLEFGIKQPKYCVLCIHSKHLEYTDEVFCSKKGFVDKFGKCMKYKYDPLKRKPEKKTKKPVFSAEDFKL